MKNCMFTYFISLKLNLKESDWNTKTSPLLIGKY